MSLMIFPLKFLLLVFLFFTCFLLKNSIFQFPLYSVIYSPLHIVLIVYKKQIID